MPVPKSIANSLTKLLEDPNSTVRISRGPETNFKQAPYFLVEVFDKWTEGLAKGFINNSLEPALESACKAKTWAETHSPENLKVACEEIKKQDQIIERLEKEIYDLREKKGYFLADLPHTVDGLPIIVGKTTVFFEKLWEKGCRHGVVISYTAGISGNEGYVRVQSEASDWVGIAAIPLSRCYSTRAAWHKELMGGL